MINPRQDGQQPHIHSPPTQPPGHPGQKIAAEKDQQDLAGALSHRQIELEKKTSFWCSFSKNLEQQNADLNIGTSKRGNYHFWWIVLHDAQRKLWNKKK